MSAAKERIQDTAPVVSMYDKILKMRERAPVSLRTVVQTEQNEVPVAEPFQIPSPLQSLLKVFNLVASGCWNFLWLSSRTIALYLIRHPLHAIFNTCVLAILWVVILTGADVHDQMILNEISDKTVDKIVSVSRFTRDFLSPEVSSAGPREYLKVGAPEWAQREGVRAILFHARKAGLSIEHQAVLLATAEVESGFNPMAKAATTSACGLFQFVKKTGEAYKLRQEDCMNPWLNAAAGVKHYIENYEKRVANNLKAEGGAERVFEMYEGTYYMHHDGPNYSNPSNDVKATILSGTTFLLKMYTLLKLENSNREKAPTFAERFAENLLATLHSVRGFLAQISGGTLAHAEQQVAHDSSDMASDSRIAS